MASMVEVEATHDFAGWYTALTTAEKKALDLVIGLLRVQGVGLGSPYSSAIKGASFALRELRPKQGASPLRVFYAFAPRRNVLLILGGDKAGDNRFYRRAIPKAEQLWATYLAKETP
jgi:hypothetical protein